MAVKIKALKVPATKIPADFLPRLIMPYLHIISSATGTSVNVTISVSKEVSWISSSAEKTEKKNCVLKISQQNLNTSTNSRNLISGFLNESFTFRPFVLRYSIAIIICITVPAMV